ncbi:hypothetical protein [Teredinibacter turnerae]|uniref:antitoxin PaaA2 family protein n=1 Tax=Teredinibacter turnerae TaxID=2426 RepID=UPI0018DEE10C|nr:hypothetical protein [Teredinibacter turnerae]
MLEVTRMKKRDMFTELSEGLDALKREREDKITLRSDVDLDAFFHAKVQEALSDTRPTVPHSQVMDDVQELIDKKRYA